MDLFFRKVVKDQGQTVAFLAGQIAEFVKATGNHDPLAAERELLGRLVDDTQAHLGVAVGHLFEAQQHRESVYKAGLHLTALLESLAETVIAWQLLRHAELAMIKIDEEPFYAGKVASARFFVRHVAPKVAARRVAVETEDGSLMNLPLAAF
jgi:hypothetical protein